MMESKPGRSPVVVAAALLGIVGLLAAVVCPTGRARAQGARLLLDPPTAQIAVDVDLRVDVRIEDVSNLHTIDLIISYDERLLQVVDADPETEGVQIAIRPFLNPSTATVNEASQATGTIRYVQSAPGPAVTGSGVVATITFRGLSNGVTAVNVDTAFLYDPNGNDIPSDAQGAIVTIGTGPPLTSTPSPTADLGGTEAGNTTPTATLELSDTVTPTATLTFTTTATPETTPAVTPSLPEETLTLSPSPEQPVTTQTPEPWRTPATLATAAVGPRDLRKIQLWPERVVGALSGAAYLDEPAVQATGLLPLGDSDIGNGRSVRGQTYLQFPFELLPVGTDILQATLLFVVDSSSTRSGQASFGVYRVIEDWRTHAWDSDPAGWPALLTSPMALAEVQIEPPSAPSQLPSASVYPSPSGALMVATSIAPTLTPNATPTLPSSPLATPAVRPQGTLPVTLTQLAETWMAWDVTALARAWCRGEVPNYGLTLGPVPLPGDEAQAAGDMLLARAYAADVPDMRPYLLLHIEVLPVTPTPTTPLLLPYAGQAAAGHAWEAAGLVLIGAALLLLGLAGRRR